MEFKFKGVKFKGMKDFFRCAFHYDEWRQEEEDKSEQLLKEEIDALYPKIFLAVKDYISENGYKVFESGEGNCLGGYCLYGDDAIKGHFFNPKENHFVSLVEVSKESNGRSLLLDPDNIHYILTLQGEKIIIGKKGRSAVTAVFGVSRCCLCEKVLSLHVMRAANVIFQNEFFGGLVWGDDLAEYKNIDDYYCKPSFIKCLAHYANQYGFSQSKYYMPHKNIGLHYLIEYHKTHPSAQFDRGILDVVYDYFEAMTRNYIFDKYGNDYFESPNNFSDDEETNETRYEEWCRDRRWRATCDENLHQFLDCLCDPKNPDNAAMFADNISSNRDAAELIREYYYCDYADRYEIFFGDKDSKTLLSKNKIYMTLESRETAEHEGN